MYSRVTLGDVVQWTQAEIVSAHFHALPIPYIGTDTRAFESGGLFAALKGPNHNGHRYLRTALKMGACALLCDEAVEPYGVTQEEVPVLRVSHVEKALVAIGEQMRLRFRGPVVAVTGSAGKSSTKKMAAILCGPGTLFPPKSYNNLLGVTQTWLAVEDSHERAVLEMGMNASGEIREMCEIYRPQGGVLTNIGDAHIGKLGSHEALFLAKRELFDFIAQLPDCRGAAVNVSNPIVVRAYHEAFGKKQPAFTYSTAFHPGAQWYAADVHTDPKSAFLSGRLCLETESFPFALPLFGAHHIENLLAAMGLARLAGVSMADVLSRVAHIQPEKHRGEVFALAQKRILIDDSYNANPAAMESSLETLKKLAPERRKVLVLGEMRELGPYADFYHQQLADHLLKLRHQGHSLFLIGVGEKMEICTREFEKKAPQLAVFCEDKTQALAECEKQLQPNDLVYVKGSRAVELDAVCDALRSQACNAQPEHMSE